MPTHDEIQDMYTGDPPVIDDAWISTAEIAFMGGDATVIASLFRDAIKWARYVRPTDEELKRIYPHECFVGAPDFAHRADAARCVIAARVLRGWAKRRGDEQ